MAPIASCGRCLCVIVNFTAREYGLDTELTLKKPAHVLDSNWVALRGGVGVITKSAVLPVTTHEKIHYPGSVSIRAFHDERRQVTSCHVRSVQILAQITSQRAGDMGNSIAPAVMFKHLLRVLFGTIRHKITSVGTVIVFRVTLEPSPI